MVLQGKAAQRGPQVIRKLYDWVLRMADHPKALWLLAGIAFIESSVFPIPPDILMIPMIIARPSRAWLIATIALVASVLGGLLGYAIGALAFDTLGQPILAMLGKADAMAEFNTRFNDLGFWAVLGAGITPFPFKVITIMSGWTGMPLGTFIVTSILARGIRFFVVAGLLWRFGAPIRDFIERRLGLVFTLCLLLLVVGFYATRYL
jgi:membrane protein YqaA with SNARE-associated domain